ncbi:hypothetical protein HK096_000453, partial [Nowakowskiella sp. JEL0078]
SGGEFLGAFSDLLQEKGIKHWRVDKGDHNKLGVVDRVIRTWKGLLQKYWTAFPQKNGIWLPVMEDLVQNYNNSRHRSISMSPNEKFIAGPKSDLPGRNTVCYPKRCSNINMRRRHSNKMGFGKGNRDFHIVQLIAEKDLFTKGFEEKYSDIPYRIKGREGNSFILERQLVDGSWLENPRRFRHHQLQRIIAPQNILPEPEEQLYEPEEPLEDQNIDVSDSDTNSDSDLQSQSQSDSNSEEEENILPQSPVRLSPPRNQKRKNVPTATNPDPNI